MGKGKAFLEVFASALHEDYRFPILEIFVFLYALGAFVFASSGSLFGSIVSSMALSDEVMAYKLINSILGVPLFIFIILIFKNVAYGLGSDLEKGIIQTYLSYPLKRRGILTAKLLSALGITLILFLTIQISALYILAPDVVSLHLGTVLLTYAANLSYPLLLAGIVLLVGLILRKGSLALVIGIVLYFAMAIITNIATFVAIGTKSPLPLQVISVFSPSVVLARYYSTDPFGSGEFCTPTYSEVLLYVGASYAIVTFLFFVGYVYFSRRFGM